MGNIVSIPAPSTVCDPSTAFSIQYSASGNATWDSQWMGLADTRSNQVGGLVQPVGKAQAATFFRDPNGLLYSADLATMKYTGVQNYFTSECLLFTPSDTTLPWGWSTVPMTIDSTNVLRNGFVLDPAYPDFVLLRDQSCVSEVQWNPSGGYFDPQKYTAITMNVVKTGTCPGKVCKLLPAGLGPVPFPDTPANFLALSDFASAANGAVTPSGYQQTFANQQASNNANGYLGYTTLPTYDVDTCSKKCNAIVGCQAFNIYFERDPKVEPGSGDNCDNPPSTTNIKCSFWGGPVTKDNAVNTGQWRKNFQIVIAGSNGKFAAPFPTLNCSTSYCMSRCPSSICCLLSTLPLKIMNHIN